MTEPLLTVQGLHVDFTRSRGWFRGSETVRAVRDVSLHVDRHETLGLVGESGSGKSTTGRAILGLTPTTGGTMTFDGVPIGAGRRVPLSVRRRLQVVFQDPSSSLDPTKVVSDLVSEPIRNRRAHTASEVRDCVVASLERVGLSADHLGRYPHEFSGGQRQRVNIARALVSDPDLVILDEPVSALDVSTQSQVINLLEEVQHRSGVSFLFIAHDLDVVRHISHRTAVMYLGRIVEQGPAERVHDQPAHPYSQALLASVPVADPDVQAERRRLRRSLAVGEPPSPLDALEGCPFASRCVHVRDACLVTFPVETPLEAGGSVHCHLYDQRAVGPQPVAVELRAPVRS